MDESTDDSAGEPAGASAHDPAGERAGDQLPGDGPRPDWVPDYVPAEWEIEGPAVSISLGDAAGVDPVLLAAMTGPDGLGGNALCQAHEQDKAADVLRPGPVLSALAEQVVGDVGRLSDDQLMGALSAARRLENRAVYLQLVTVAEFGRRRAAQAARARAGRRREGLSSGDFPDTELSVELLITERDAGQLLGDAASLTTRLPRTLAGMAAGSIDYARAATIVGYTDSLSDADAARADEVLAAVAPGLRPDRLARKAAALEMKLDPAAARARKERGKQDRRVEVRRERSGNASISGRELPAAEVMASKANLDAIAARLRAADVAGTLDSLRAWALTELLQGRDPLRGITPDSDPASRAAPEDPDVHAPGTAGPDAPAPGPAAARAPRIPDPRPGRTAPFPAKINMIVPVGNLLGYSDAPAWAGSWGLLDAADTRDIVAAASRHPATRWGVTFTGPDGTAIAHAAVRGRHPWTPPPDSPAPQPSRPQPPGSQPPDLQPLGPQPPGLQPPPVDDNLGPSPEQAARLLDLLRALGITPEPIARRSCDHRHAEDRYTPSRKLADLIRARTATCSVPGCGAQAVHCDLDHTTPYPRGITCECNLHPPSKR